MEQHSVEHWLPVVGWEGIYEVSDHGRARSVDRTVVNKLGHTQRYRSRLLTLVPSSGGYLCLNFKRSPRKQWTLIHLVVLEAFVGPAPEGYDGCHWDDDPTNNLLTNLRWDTKSANRHDAIRNGRDPRACRTHCLRGHLLERPNLSESQLLRNGYRNCLACMRGRTNVRDAKRDGRPVPDLQRISDWHYEKIMTQQRGLVNTAMWILDQGDVGEAEG